MRLVSILLFCTFAFASISKSQVNCPETLYAGEDLLLCFPGGQATLNASFSGAQSNILDISWTPAQGLSNPNILNPIANITQHRTYQVRVRHYSNDNLIFNGDFEQGNVGFTSDYLYSPNNLVPEGVYAITTNPSIQHSGFAPCGDHTSGSGNMMAVNGAGIPNQRVWCQTVNVNPNTDYVFITWATSLHPSSPAILQFSANNILLGNSFQLSPVSCQWAQFYAVWNSGNASSANFCIVNQNTVLGGNDFALDDIFLAEVCEYIDEVEVDVRERVETPLEILICQGERVIIGQEIFDIPGEYSITLQDEHGCDSIISLSLETLNVEAIIEDPVALTCGNPISELDGSNSFGDFPIISWHWTTQSGIILSDPNREVVTVGAPGFYALTVGVYHQGKLCLDSTEVYIESDTIKPAFRIEQPGRLSCQDTSLRLRASNIGHPSQYRYSWSSSQGTILEGENTLSPLVGGIGTYILLVTDINNGCSASFAVEVLGDTALPEIDVLHVPKINCRYPVAEIHTSVRGSAQSYHIVWETQDGEIVYGQNSIIVGVRLPGVYTLTAIDSISGCRASRHIEVHIDTAIPSAHFKPIDTLGCSVDQLHLQVEFEPDDLSLEFYWTTQDGTILEGENTANPIVGDAGTYQLIFVQTENGCSDTLQIRIIRYEDLPHISLGPDLTIDCRQTMVTPDISGTSIGPRFRYQWYLNNVLYSNEATPSLSNAGRYILVVTNEENGCSNSDSIAVVDIRNNPILYIYVPEVLTCARDSIRLSNIYYDVNDPHYTWFFPDQSISHEIEPRVSAAGWYYVTITDELTGCSSNDSVQVFQDVSTPSLVFEPADTLDCEKRQIVLSVKQSTPFRNLEFLWDTDGGSILSDPYSPEVIINAAGIYRVTITDLENGCMATDSILVLRSLDLPEVHISSPAMLTCRIREIEIVATMSAGYPNIAFHWSTQNGLILSGDQALQILVDRSGTYVFHWSNLDNGCEDSLSVEVIENIDAPWADAGDDKRLPCDPPLTSLKALEQANVMYSWGTLNGRIIGPSNTPEIVVDRPGLYSLTVTNTDNGCIAVDSVSVRPSEAVIPILDIHKPTCSTPLGKLRFLPGEGGTPPYQYLLNGLPYFPGQEAALVVGLHTVEIRDQNGCKSDTLFSITPPLVLQTQHIDFIKIDQGEEELITMQFSRPLNEILSVEWEPSYGVTVGSNIHQWYVHPERSVDYFIRTQTIDSCISITTLEVLVVKNPRIFVPNVFTPRDRNGINDRLFPMSRTQDIKIVRKMEIFDRWGDRVFKATHFPVNEAIFGWDGYYKGFLVNPAVFVWTLEVEMNDGEILVLFGDVTVL